MSEPTPRPTAPAPAAAAPPTRPAGPGPDRLALVQAYRVQALERPDPLAANLGMMAGDLFVLTHALGTRLAAAPDPAAARGFGRDVEMYLKITRQIDRLAQLERRAPAVIDGE
ncbi:MAG: hypothetical protein ACJ8F7_01060 [Gemmataceae bacterium]